MEKTGKRLCPYPAAEPTPPLLPASSVLLPDETRSCRARKDRSGSRGARDPGTPACPPQSCPGGGLPCHQALHRPGVPGCSFSVGACTFRGGGLVCALEGSWSLSPRDLWGGRLRSRLSPAVSLGTVFAVSADSCLLGTEHGDAGCGLVCVPPARVASRAPPLQRALFSGVRCRLQPLFTACFGLLQPQLVLGGAAQTASLGTATAVQTGTPQRTVPGTTTTSTAATVSALLMPLRLDDVCGGLSVATEAQAVALGEPHVDGVEWRPAGPCVCLSLSVLP